LSKILLEESLALLSRYCFEEINCLNHKRIKERGSNKYKYQKHIIHFEEHNKEEPKTSQRSA